MKDGDIVIISYQNGRYEVYDCNRNETIIGKINGITMKMENLTAYGAIKLAMDIVEKYEGMRLKEKHHAEE